MAEIIAHLVASSARESRREEGPMAAEYSGTIPKRGDRVGIAQQEGVFEVVDINSLMQTANVKSTDGIAPKCITVTAGVTRRGNLRPGRVHKRCLTAIYIHLSFYVVSRVLVTICYTYARGFM
jgi:hypothetical protein